MTSKEKVMAALNRRNNGVIPVSLTPWESTLQKWLSEETLKDRDFWEHFNLDMRRGAGCINSIANLDVAPQILEETEDTKLVLDGNGATLRLHKAHESTPEHVDFRVKDNAGWLEYARLFLIDVDERRFDAGEYRKAKQIAA